MYESIRDNSKYAEARAFLEQMWDQFKPAQDPNFIEDAKAHFYERTWELYLWHVFTHYGCHPQKVGAKGPDFYITLRGRKFFVEAIAPGPGEGLDAVPPLMIGGGIAHEVPEEKILLRITHGLREKALKYSRDLSNGIIGADDGYLIAFDGWLSSGYRSGDDSMPWLIKATVGIGPLEVWLDPEGKEPPESLYRQRAGIPKSRGQQVSAIPFLTDEYVCVSAALYSDTQVPFAPALVGSEMTLFHNPRAKNCLPFGALQFGREYWVGDEGRIKLKEWQSVPF